MRSLLADGGVAPSAPRSPMWTTPWRLSCSAPRAGIRQRLLRHRRSAGRETPRVRRREPLKPPRASPLLAAYGPSTALPAYAASAGARGACGGCPCPASLHTDPLRSLGLLARSARSASTRPASSSAMPRSRASPRLAETAPDQLRGSCAAPPACPFTASRRTALLDTGHVLFAQPHPQRRSHAARRRRLARHRARSSSRAMSRYREGIAGATKVAARCAVARARRSRVRRLPRVRRPGAGRPHTCSSRNGPTTRGCSGTSPSPTQARLQADLGPLLGGPADAVFHATASSRRLEPTRGLVPLG